MAATRREFLATAAAAVAATELGSGLHAPVHAADPAAPNPAVAIPPHRPLEPPGVHVYTDRPSYAAGEALVAYVSNSLPCEVQIVRLGRDLDGTAEDEALHSLHIDRPAIQAVHPGSYVHIPRGLPAAPHTALSLECWIRLWNLAEPQGIITQLDGPSGIGVLAFPDGKVGFFSGECPAPCDTPHRSSTALSLPGQPTASRYITPHAAWHHVVAIVSDGTKSLWVDGRLAGAWEQRQPVTPAECPLRIGARGEDGVATGFLDADIALPAVYGRALAPTEVQARFADSGVTPPASDHGLLGCWPLDEERGATVRDMSGAQRHGKIINQATWMIGGPPFDAAISDSRRSYDPRLDAKRGHGLRLASDDLFDCRWRPTITVTLPDDARPGLYAARVRFADEEGERMTHSVFVVRRAANAPPAPIALLFATNTWKAYSAAPFCPAWPGVFARIGNQGHRPAGSDPWAAYSFYRFHRAGQPTYKLGWRLPWPAASPYALASPLDIGYGHLSRADRFAQQWLIDSGYVFDALCDLDLHHDERALDGAKVLMIVGHSEYWSSESMRKVRAFLDHGGKVICLSGNSMYWRVTHDPGEGIIECRKAGGGGAQIAAAMLGECWHEHDCQRGGVLRDCDDPSWQTIGVESVAATPMNAASAANAFRVVDAAHPFFHSPHETDLTSGDRFGFDPARRTRQPLGHESDVRVSTLMDLTRRLTQNLADELGLDDAPGIQLLGQARFEADAGVGTVLDYVHRPVKPALRRPDDSICDIIHWQRPEGGEVFAAPSIAASWTLAVCPKWSAILKNVLHAFGVQPR